MTENEYLDSFDYLYSLLVNGNIEQYKQRLKTMSKKELVSYIFWARDQKLTLTLIRLDYILKEN